MTGVLADPILYRTDILPRLNWVPYVAGSVFGRDGFDDSRKWINSSIQNGWISITNYFVYQNAGTGSISFFSLLPQYRKELTSEVIPVQTHAYNSYSGTLTIASGIFTVDMG